MEQIDAGHIRQHTPDPHYKYCLALRLLFIYFIIQKIFGFFWLPIVVMDRPGPTRLEMRQYDKPVVSFPPKQL